jgi:hypothetical protein
LAHLFYLGLFSIAVLETLFFMYKERFNPPKKINSIQI